MTTASLPLPGTTERPSRRTVVRALLFVLTVLAAAAIAFVVGHETSGTVHTVRNISTPTAYWPQVSCHAGVPC